MKMDAVHFVRSIARHTRSWRDSAVESLRKAGCTDLSYRPSSGMSAFGWLLAHQAAVFDYTLNMLIKKESPKKPDLFALYTPGTEGEWAGTPLKEIEQYYDSCEQDLIDWTEQADDAELERVLQGEDIPTFFQGMRVIDVIANAFVHLNHHNGHLSAIKGDWSSPGEK